MTGPKSAKNHAASAGAPSSELPRHKRQDHAKKHQDKLKQTREKQIAIRQTAPRQIPKLLLSEYERWLIKIIRNIQCPDKLFVPPSLDIFGLGGSGARFAFRFAPTSVGANGAAAPTGSIVLDNADSRAIDHFDGLDNTATHQLNYMMTGGRVLHEVTLTGSEGMFAWFDPLDINSPLRINRGPASGEFWHGSLVGSNVSPYNDIPQGVSEHHGWTNSPFIFPTDYSLPEADAVTGFAKCELYPHGDGYPVAGAGVYCAAGTSFLVYPVAVRFTIQEVSTAFTAVSMKARSADAVIEGSALQRLFNRIEDPRNGAYGYYAAPIQSKCTQLAYRATKWAFPHAYTTNIAAGATPVMPSVDAVPPPIYAAVGVSNWHSLQRALTSDYPMVEVRQVSEDANSTSTLTIAVEVDYAISPTSLVSGMASHAGVSMDCTVPPFLGPFQLTGGVRGASSSAIVPVSKAHVHNVVANEVAHKALHEVASYHPSTEIKALAHAAPTGNAFTRFIDTIANGIERAIPVVGKVVDVASKIGGIIATL